MRPVIAVACGVLRSPDGEVLIAQRPAGKIAAGQWEFPGGKIEPGESALAALQRELHEELGIEVGKARPLIRIRHDYSDRCVLLDVWMIEQWSGAIHGREQQAFAWTPVAGLAGYDLLAADAPIVKALSLPPHYVFSPPLAEVAELVAGLDALPEQALLRLRLPDADDESYRRAAGHLLPELRARGMRLMLDRDPQMVLDLGADGWHVRASLLEGLSKRPAGLVFASCHNAGEAARARTLGADAVVLGPVQETRSHPGAHTLSWPGFSALALEASLPAYAIGGLGPGDLPTAYAHHAQGVAGITAYWPPNLPHG